MGILFSGDLSNLGASSNRHGKIWTSIARGLDNRLLLAMSLSTSSGGTWRHPLPLCEGPSNVSTPLSIFLETWANQRVVQLTRFYCLILMFNKTEPLLLLRISMYSHRVSASKRFRNRRGVNCQLWARLGFSQQAGSYPVRVFKLRASLGS